MPQVSGGDLQGFPDCGTSQNGVCLLGARAAQFAAAFSEAGSPHSPTRFPNLDISLATKTGQMMCYRHLERVRARVL